MYASDFPAIIFSKDKNLCASRYILSLSFSLKRYRPFKYGGAVSAVFILIGGFTDGNAELLIS
ncbi:hypothetical protein PGRAT_15940 [Paenibacillus graminis]|uniref:Uncharacterized protein n=1 Tax=Paenibacillus graminis TaxID=189425 RepID=A0A089M589_9BACL|nr:hypothetical protein PGRAT_15940 [Paenibacillus graminis]